MGKNAVNEIHKFIQKFSIESKNFYHGYNYSYFFYFFTKHLVGVSKK